MPTPSVHDAVRAMLLRRGVAQPYVDRLARELGEHREDLVRELLTAGLAPEAAERAADRTLGDPAVLAEVAFERCRLGSFTGRYPVLALVLMPAVSIPLAYAVVLLLTAWAGGMLSPSFRVGTMSPQSRALLVGACRFCAYGVPAACAAGFYVWARRCCCCGGWIWAPCLVLAVVSSFVFLNIFTTGGGAVTVGRIVVGATGVPDASKMLMPVGVTLLLEWSRRVRGNRGTELGARA